MEKSKHHLIRLISSSHFLKLVTKILLPFSVLSVILSYPLLCNFHILTFDLQLFSFSAGKNYMFLLCNGLLVFIATSSGLIGSFSVETNFKSEETLKNKGGSQRELQVKSLELKGSISKTKVIPKVDQEAQGRENVPSIVQDEDEEQRHEDEDFGLMSNEELNKKCEDFIRRMKEGIKFEVRELVKVQQSIEFDTLRLQASTCL
ncbi:hypothetical protein CRYUN_Cryun23aG0046600 [Craigia yunnanensis]